IETEADIAETEVPVEVEDIDDPIAAGGDVRHGPLGVLGDAELADEVVAAAAGDDAQRGVRIDEAGRNRTRHPSPPSATTRGAPSAAKPAASSFACSSLVLLTSRASRPCAAKASMSGSMRLSTAPLRAVGLRTTGTAERSAFGSAGPVTPESVCSGSSLTAWPVHS